MSKPIHTVGVIGTGVIGASWTGLFLANGLKVLVSDPAPGAEQKLKDHLDEIWPTLKELGLSPSASLSNYTFVGGSLKEHYDKVDFIQENAPERLDLKETLFTEIDAETKPDVIIASSSSGIPSSKFIGKCSKNPGRILIGHPFNPPHLMPLVEIVPHPGTSQSIISAARTFYTDLGKRPIVLNQETPGFAANRLQAAVTHEACSLVARGVLSAEDLDACMTTSLGPRWSLTGPFMSNVLGGGGGKDGFRHLLEHLGPGMQGWLDDMHTNEVSVVDKDIVSKLDASVQKMLENHDPHKVEAERDGITVKLLKLKKEEGADLV